MNMRFIEPSPGEAYDRLTILSLKIAKASAAQKNDVAAVFQKERTALENYIHTKGYDVPADLCDELHKINERLWRLEDEQRERLKRLAIASEPNGFLTDIGENAVTVIQLNDARADVVQRINRACGVEHPEKLYGMKETQKKNQLTPIPA
jgi:hypothetical protein